MMKLHSLTSLLYRSFHKAIILRNSVPASTSLMVKNSSSCFFQIASTSIPKIPPVGLNRNFATAAKKEKLIVPPKRIYGLAGRYAEALYSAASKQNQLNAVETDLVKLQSLITTDEKVRNIILDPVISKKIKPKDMEDIGARLSLNPLTINFLKLLSENKRVAWMEQIIAAFQVIMVSFRGELVCEVISATSLPADKLKAIENNIKSSFKSKKMIIVRNTVDPTIVGGMVVKLEDYVIDMSISTQLRNWERLLSKSLKK